jgi:hypothetical protein
MEIRPYEPAMADQLTTAYNSAIRYVPYCYPVSAKELASALAEDHGLRARQVFVALEGQSITGFAHVGVGYRHASISTAVDNYRAALLYANLGYRVVDWTYGLGRHLDGGPDAL